MNTDKLAALGLHLALMALIGYFGITGAIPPTDCILACGIVAGVAMPSTLGGKAAPAAEPVAPAA